MSDREFAPVPAIPAPPDPPSRPSDGPSLRERLGGIAFALFVPLGVYAEACAGYFATACRPIDLGTNLEWSIFVMAVVPITLPIPCAVVYLAAAGGLFAAPRTPRAVRIWNRIALALAVIVPIGAAIAGAIAPTRCTLF